MFCLLSVYLFRPVQDPDFAEVLTDLNSRELFWLSRGQLEIAVETEGQDARKISGFITGRKSCDSKCPSKQQQNTFARMKQSRIFPSSIFPKHHRGIKRGSCWDWVFLCCTGFGLLHVWLFPSSSLYKYLLFVRLLSTLITGREPCLPALC